MLVLVAVLIIIHVCHNEFGYIIVEHFKPLGFSASSQSLFAGEVVILSLLFCLLVEFLFSSLSIYLFVFSQTMTKNKQFNVNSSVQHLVLVVDF